MYHPVTPPHASRQLLRACLVPLLQRSVICLALLLVLLASLFPTLALAQARPTISASFSPSTLTVGQPFKISWVASNAQWVNVNCTNGGPNEEMLSTTGEVNGIAQPSWASAPPSCNVIAWTDRDAMARNTFTLRTSAPPSVNFAEIVSQSFPSAMVTGQTYPVSFTLKNTGTTTWTAAEQYRLGVDIEGWGVQRVELPSSVAPGQQQTFNFNVTAPAAGTYSVPVRMLREFYEWFGNAAANYVVVAPLTNNAQIVAQSAPTEMVSGRTYPVSVTVRNTGNTTWSAATSYALGSQNPQDNLIWGTGRVQINSVVPPGGQYTFSFNVVAPASANYNMQWRMLREGVEWFGGTSSSPVGVTPAPVAPTITVQRLPSPMKADEAYSVNWNATNATSVTYRCTASGTGYNATETVAVKDTKTGTASAQWINFPSTCTWTATGPGGTKSVTETMTTVASQSSSPTPNSVAIAPPHLANVDAGTLPGELGVNRNGAATYTVSIEVPPGTNTVQPALSLDYNGQNPNGPLGLGWSLGGMPSIHRCGKTIAQDGVNERIGFNNKDRLCLDGQRLILVNRAVNDDNYWSPGAEYRTEIESLTRITSESNGPGGALSFRVQTKDGRIATYGIGSAHVKAIVGAINSGIGGAQPSAKNGAQSWAIDRVEDRLRNYISYSYDQDSATGEHRLTFIRYGGAGLSAHAAVEFIYESRPDAWKRYIDETRNDLRLRLSKIRTYVGDNLDGNPASAGTLVRDYLLSYEQSPTSGRSMLAAIKACARNPQSAVLDCLPETRFNWGKPDSSKTASFVSRGFWSGAPVLTTNNASGGRVFGANHADYFAFSDFNRDGLSDVLEKRVASAVPIDMKTYDGAERERSNPIQPGTLRTQYRYFRNTGNGFAVHNYQLNTLESFAVLDVGDFNGDGAPDLFVIANSVPKICLSPFGTSSAAPGTMLTFTCGRNLPYAWRNASGGQPYIFDPLGDGRSAVYSTVKNGGTATFCTIDSCIGDNAPPYILGNDDQNFVINEFNGSTEFQARQFISFNQMIDFAGNGKPFDTRWTRVYVEQYRYDGKEQILSNTWKNLQPRVVISGLGVPGSATSKIADYVYPGYPYPTGLGYAPYDFDEPYQGNGLSADFNGSGYNSLVFGFIEVGRDVYPTLYNKKAETTLCLSTGRSLDCSVRRKFSGAQYRAVKAVGNFVGDGAPDVMVSPLVAGTPGARPVPSGAIQICRVKGDDTTNGTGTDDANMVCTPWSGVTLPENAPGALIDQVYFMDLLGTGRTQLVYYHSGNFVNGSWQEDGRWELFEPLDVAAPGQALDRLVSVTNGLGAVSSVEYADGIPTNTVATTNTIAREYPVQSTTTAGKIVRQVNIANGVGEPRRRSYQYRDAATHVAGRGALGFATVITTDLQNNFVTTTNYAQDFPRVGMELSSTTVAGSCVISKVDNLIELQSFAQSNGLKTTMPFVRSNTAVKRDIDAGCSAMGTVSSTNTLDAWGNPSQSVVTSKDDAETLVTTTSTTFRNDAANWLLGLPINVTVTKTTTAPQASVVRTMDFDYDAVTGLLKQEITEKGDQQYQVVTNYLRDGNPFGLVRAKTQTWFDSAKATLRSRTLGEMTYDAKGRYPLTVKNALGHVETHDYYPETGARKSLKDANALTTSWVVNGFGRMTKEVRPDGTEIRMYEKACKGDCPGGAVVARMSDTFNGADRITVPQVQYSDNAGHVLRTLTYGFDGRVTVTDQRFDARGRLTEKYWPRFENASALLDSRVDYDDLDRVKNTSRYDGRGQLTSSSSEYKGLTTVLTNARGFKRTEKRNVAGQLREVLDPNNKPTSFEYEPFGNLSKTTDPNRNVIRVVYDRMGRKTNLYDPDLGNISYVIDPLGRLLTQTSPKQRARFAITGSANELTRFDYDNLDRMIGRYEPDLTSNWIFDTAARGVGQLAEAYTSTGTVKDYRRVHTYDTFARPQKTTQTLSDGSYSSESTYDAWGRLITQTYQRNAEAVKKFENRYQNGYLARVERGSLVLWKLNIQDASQRPTSATLGNGLTQVHRFNDYNGQIETGTLSTTAGGARLQESYEYDAMLNVEKRLQYWDQGGFQESFSYDALNRIATSVLLGQAVQTFTYDDAGNLLTKTGVGTGAYQYPAQGASAVRPHAVQTIPGIGSFNYDDNGNLTGGAGRTVEWTSFDMPVKITANQTTATFVYGAEHQRTRQVRGDGSTVIYAGAQEVEKNASGTVVKTYWPAGIGVEIDRPGSTTSELLWYHHDRLGSVIGLTDQQGTLAEKLAYDAWGKRRTIDGALVNGTSTPNNLDGKKDYRGFTGHEMLDQLDLVHMNGRIYDPLVARFLSGDPFIQDPVDGQNYNRYTYVLNNPTNNTDPTGFICQSSGGDTSTGSHICGVETGATCSGNCKISDGSKDDKGRSKTKREQQPDPRANASNASNPNGGVLAQLRDGYTGDNRSVMWGETAAEQMGRYASNLVDFAVGFLPGSSLPEVGKQAGARNYAAAAIALSSELLGPLGKGARGIGGLEKAYGKYSVGVYQDIKGTVSGMDAHHVGQKALMKDMIPNYDPATAPAILVPKVGHTIRGPQGIVSRSTDGLPTPRSVMSRDIRELRRVYPDIPNSKLRELINMNKDIYPGSFIK
jgi:RHS repeat-associated protein